MMNQLTQDAKKDFKVASVQSVGFVSTLANSDMELFKVWLDAKGGRSLNTYDSYRREGNRLLCWLRENGLGLKEIKVEHVHQFYEHLKNPPDHWKKTRKQSRHQRLLETQLLVSGLDDRAINYTRTVLSQMCSYGQDLGYLSHNVFKLSRKANVIQLDGIEKFLDLKSWNWLWNWSVSLCGRQLSPSALSLAWRNRWILALSYHTGLRRQEMASSKMSDFFMIDDVWFLRVVGKGSKSRDVTINSVLLRELIKYRNFLNKKDLPSLSDDCPLIAPLYGKSKCLTPRSIGKIIEKISEYSAKDCDDESIKKRLLDLTTHQMRHTNGTHRYLAGCSTESTQGEFGHTDPKTTMIYQKVLVEKRKSDAEKLALLGKNSEIY